MHLKNDGGGLKIIIPKKPYIFTHSNFKDKQYVITSPEICKVLYDHYGKNTKDIIVKVIKNFAKIAGSLLASKFVEMMANDILQKGGTFKVRRLTKDSNEGSEKLPVRELTLKELKHKQFREIDEYLHADKDYEGWNYTTYWIRENLTDRFARFLIIGNKITFSFNYN
ncbi:hypothetical protein C1646_753305 [Rhizophagus diaphanus]|nr:hypothetical protein C1646_753305 [Rhizophagus diaphanus] [Rhizophagus sp. MUCL 43196]